MQLRTEYSKAMAEAIGTFSVVFAGSGAIMVAERFPGTISASAIPLVFGLAVAAMIYAVGHISGAHFNPAVTLAFAVARHFPKKQVLQYWLAQFLGAIAAVALLSQILPPGTSCFGRFDLWNWDCHQASKVANDYYYSYRLGDNLALGRIVWRGPVFGIQIYSVSKFQNPATIIPSWKTSTARKAWRQ